MSPKRGFFDLPAEIRNNVYEHMLDNCGEARPYCASGYNGYNISYPPLYPDPIHISTRFRDEFAPTYYRRCALRVQVSSPTNVHYIAEDRLRYCTKYVFDFEPGRSDLENPFFVSDAKTSRHFDGVHLDLQWFRNPDLPSEDEEWQIKTWVADALHENGNRHLTQKQLGEVVEYAEVVRKDKTMQKNYVFFAQDFWAMVEG